jgi:DNA-binding NarL/FixJ family response regulator
MVSMVRKQSRFLDAPAASLENTNRSRAAKARLYIVHRSRMFRECMKAVLSGQLDIEVAEVDFAAASAMIEAGRVPADVVVVDSGFPGSGATELIHGICAANCHAKVLVVVSSSAQEVITECIAAGANGCIYEDSSLDDLRTAIDEVRAQGTFCSRDMLQVVFSQFARMAREHHLRKWVESEDLTSREIEILQLISAHLGNKQIAKRLSISLYTVKNHVHNILEKLKLSTRFEAVDYARKRQWINLSGPDTRSGPESKRRT